MSKEDSAGNVIETVGIYLTEDERRLLTSLASDLECREESALRRSEGAESQTYAATRDALHKLMYLPASSAVVAERLRYMVTRAVAGEMREYRISDDGMEPPMTLLDQERAALFTAIADRVVKQLALTGGPK